MNQCVQISLAGTGTGQLVASDGGENLPQALEIACNPDCPETPFPHRSLWPYPHYITLPGGCVVAVEYATRYACGIWHDLYIARIITRDANDPACLAYFNSNSAAEIMAEVTRQMLLDNPMGFPPLSGNNLPDTCVSNWRVIKGSCWQKIYANFGSPENPYWQRILYPCSGSVCCLDHYRVCRINGERVITSLPGSVQGDCLPNQPYVQGGQACEPACGGVPIFPPQQ